jgi:hypothetical protein
VLFNVLKGYPARKFRFTHNHKLWKAQWRIYYETNEA